MQRRNSKKPRRWRNVRLTQNACDYELECNDSERVAIVNSMSRPFHWAIWSPGGKVCKSGDADTLLKAKQDARAALDEMTVE